MAIAGRKTLPTKFVSVSSITIPEARVERAVTAVTRVNFMVGRR